MPVASAQRLCRRSRSLRPATRYLRRFGPQAFRQLDHSAPWIRDRGGREPERLVAPIRRRERNALGLQPIAERLQIAHVEAGALDRAAVRTDELLVRQPAEEVQAVA